MTYQIAICDDEEKQRAYIKSLVEGWLRQTFHHTKIQEYASSEQFLFEQAYDRTQILFLDIEMEKMDGIALAREIRKHNRQMQIIFVTGYMEYIQEGYDVEALHYLLKPVSQEKIDSVLDRAVERVTKIYGGKKVVLTANAQKQAKELTALGFANCPICVAKTQYSLTDDQTKLGAPTDFEVTVRNLKVSAGAGFIVALTGEIMTMPGLPKVPAAEKIDVDENGKITGLF